MVARPGAASSGPGPVASGPAGEGRIGPAWAAAEGGTLRRDPEGGLLPDLSRLAGADRLHPAVRSFYEHTARTSLSLGARWWAGLSLPGRAWAALYARRWGQLDLPFGRPGADSALTNEIYSASGADPSQWWVRRYPDDRALYVSRYDLVDVSGEPDPCIRIAFPIPGGTWVVLFRGVIVDGALVLTEAGGRPGGPGAYWSRPADRPGTCGRSARRLRDPPGAVGRRSRGRLGRARRIARPRCRRWRAGAGVPSGTDTGNRKRSSVRRAAARTAAGPRSPGGIHPEAGGVPQLARMGSGKHPTPVPRRANLR